MAKSVYFFKTLVTIYQTKRCHISGIYSLNYVSHSMSTGKVFPRGKWLGHEVDHTPSARAKVKNKWQYTKLPCVRLHGLHRGILFTFFAFYMKHCSNYLRCYVAFICGHRCWTIAYTTSDPDFQLPIEQNTGLLQVCSDVMVKTNPKSHGKSDWPSVGFKGLIAVRVKLMACAETLCDLLLLQKLHRNVLSPSYWLHIPPKCW